MAKAISNRIYSLYGRFYDASKFLFRKRLQKAISSVPFHPGDRVLDVGIGTGLSLEFYPDDVQVTGIDLCPAMLAQAQKKLDTKATRAAPRSHTQLLQANALDLPFPNESFDTVFLSHLITTVPDPYRCLAEAFRVARPHAHLVIVNHFRSPYPVLSWLETAVDPICRKLGWRSDLSLTELLAPASVENLHLAPETPGLLFRIVYLEKSHGKLRLARFPAPLPQTEPTFDPA
ncbi:MAG TPA: methyltransferase domain-containing protein [Phycisphaerae bacterium]|jgi:phosphatidylethanolamine/phosphatidyl-N-methylethanolamine N-methyltransferase|nr:methyltransferase domain-containing protein [Phycisphaerae bacterium]